MGRQEDADEVLCILLNRIDEAQMGLSDKFGKMFTGSVKTSGKCMFLLLIRQV